jgi:aminoglycoside N3'-acetyltransferase
MITGSQLKEVIQEAGLSGSTIALHSSLSSFGSLQGGAQALIEAFLAQGCTLLVPTFTYLNEAQVERQIPQNGQPHSAAAFAIPGPGYDPQENDIVKSMGAVPARLLAAAGRKRGNHPLNSFAALGPLAEALIEEQAPLNVYGPYQRMYDHPPAFLVLVGVDLTSATPVHFAEERAGRRLFRRWGKQGGQTVECQVGSCSQGFNRLLPIVQPIERQVQAGQSLWRVYPLAEFIDRISAAMRAGPQITHCEDDECPRCADAVRGGPLLENG